MQSIQSILSIAGFDPSCGAGICADVRTARSLSFYACPVITAITFQNSCEVLDFNSTGKVGLEKQLKAVLDDISIDAIKIGMIPDEAAAQVIAKTVKKLKVPKVLDPVIKSTTGFKIGSAEICRIVIGNCSVVTPNAYEAEQLTGIRVVDVNSAKKAAAELSDGFSVVITGVNGKDIILDADSEKLYVLGKELEVGKVHGTGCVYSTSLACFLANGMELFDASKKARRLTISAARRAIKIGGCLPVVNL